MAKKIAGIFLLRNFNFLLSNWNAKINGSALFRRKRKVDPLAIGARELPCEIGLSTRNVTQPGGNSKINPVFAPITIA